MLADGGFSVFDGFTATLPMPSANGITESDGWVYISNTGQAVLLRCRYGVAGPASPLETVALQLVADDFDVGSNGRIYLATHFLNTVVQLDPDGTRTTIAGFAQGVVGSTSVAIDSRDSNALLVTTTGGMKGPRNPGDEPARLVRLRL